MKVLLIDVNCKYSSTGKIVYDLYTSLNDQGHIAAICYGRGPLVKEPNIYKFSSNVETYIHAFLTRVTGLTGIYSPLATRNLIKYIDRFKPDVVHIHELHAYFVNISALINYLKKKNIKTIWTFHCEFMYTGKCGHAYDCEKWKSKCEKCPQVRDYPASFYFDNTDKMFLEKKKLFADFNNLVIVTPSRWLADRVRHSFLKDKDIRVVHNGIDTENIFYPRNFEHLKAKHNLTDEKIVLVVAPNIMEERKGGRWVIELAKIFKGLNVKFILIGVNILNQKFDDSIIAISSISNQIELAEYYSMADVFVICSKRENFPTTCIEALCCGTPIAGFDEGGIKETAPNQYGKFVKYGDLEALKVSVLATLNQHEDTTKKNTCEMFAKTNYSKTTMFQNYFNIYG